MAKLVEKNGNVHQIIGQLIDEIKMLPLTRKGDFKAFEQLSLRVNDFHDRLVLMGREQDVENSYILKKIESKLNFEDFQRWLVSQGDEVDERMVRHLLAWLEKQTHLRRIAGRNAPRSLPYTYTGYARKPATHAISAAGSALSPASSKCRICSLDHSMEDCPTFLWLPLNERWDRLKVLRACFMFRTWPS